MQSPYQEWLAHSTGETQEPEAPEEFPSPLEMVNTRTGRLAEIAVRPYPTAEKGVA